jgi:Ca2+-binding RTX toxin-like protein
VGETSWDLTGGLTVTGPSGGIALFGTGYGDTITGGSGDDTIYAYGGNDTVNGGSGADYIYGGDGNDVLSGGGGADTLYGNAGADTFLFLHANALGTSVGIADFNTGQDDKIDIADVLDGYWNGTDPIADFVALTTSGLDTLLRVDLDGTGGTYSLTQIATIQGVTGLSLNDLISNDNLIVQAA